MRFVPLSATLLVALSGCVSSTVEKQEDYVTVRQRTPKPRAQRAKVAVLKFEDRSHYGKEQLGTSAADVFQEFLVESQQFRVMERTDLDAVVAEQRLTATDASAIGKALECDFVFVGVVTNFGYTTQGDDFLVYEDETQLCEAEVTVKLIDPKTGELLMQKSGRGYADTQTQEVMGLGGEMSFDQRNAGRALRAAIAKFVDKLIDATE
jgi:curli biogenesis system outer membrane secretion channel CsgG